MLVGLRVGGLLSEREPDSWAIKESSCTALPSKLPQGQRRGGGDRLAPSRLGPPGQRVRVLSNAIRTLRIPPALGGVRVKPSRCISAMS